MALFTSYAPPGVYTQEIFNPQASAAIGTARIPVILGEGEEFFTFANVELFRGSSASQDDQAVNENISNQVTGLGRHFHTSYSPVVDGTGKGIVTNDATKLQVSSVDTNGNATPVTVITLDGLTGDFSTQEIIPEGTSLELTYFFARTDTLVTNEDLSAQIPKYASLTVTGASSSSLVVSTTLPGAVGNFVTLSLVDGGSGTGVADALAVSGAGTDSIQINIRKAGTPGTIRTVVDLQTLISGGIATLSAGYLTSGTLTGAGALIPGSASLSGGLGQSSNTIFKTHFTPIVDGTNGGIVTTNPINVTVLYDGNPAVVSAVDGANGLITLQNAAQYTHTLAITYYRNAYQNTSDLLPASNVATVTQVGLGPNRSDFTQNTDYVLGVDSNGNPIINWGASTKTTVGVSTGAVAFGPAEIKTTLVDEKVYLRPLTGLVDGKNTVFTLEDVPTDGSGLAVITDDPTKVSVYVGADPVSAQAVTVARLSGATGTVTLYNPPQSGQKVYATYYRNLLNDHVYTVKVAAPGAPAVGTYTIADELGYVLPHVLFDKASSSVTAGNFATAGLKWPNDNPDLVSPAGAVDETVTVTFVDTGLTTGGTAGVQAHVTTQGITFMATTVGTAGNSVGITFTSVGTADNAAITGNGTNALTVDILKADATTVRTLTDIVNLFTTRTADVTTTGGGVILASGTGFIQMQVAGSVPLAGGVNAISGTAYAMKFNVTSSAAGGSTGTGYVGQTYIDNVTALKFTVVDPQTASPSYRFAPLDDLKIVVSKSTAFTAGGVVTDYINPTITIPGLSTTVITTFNAATNDTALIYTYNKAGNSPGVGNFYYVSFTTDKTANDYKLKIYTNPSDAYAVYGQPSTINRLSLGIQLMSLNGVQAFGAIQVKKQPNTNLAASSDYTAGLQQLTKHLPGFNRKCDVVVPLSNDPSVHQALSRQLISQAGPRQKGEAIGFVGYSQFVTPDQARGNARALKNSRMIAIGNAAAGIMVTNLTTGQALEYVVDGTFMAAAMAGLNCNPANDVATTLTLQNLVGFSRLLITYDDPTMDFMAADGLTMLLNNNGALQIRHYKSTDPSNDLTSEPTSITISDYVAQQFRLDLQQFIGRKLVDSLVTDIAVVCNARLKSLVDNVIISGYQGLSVVVNASDPTEVDVTVTFKPIFSLLYASVTFVVQTSL